MTTETEIWFAVEISVARAASEAIEYAFNELDSCGTEISDLGAAPKDRLLVIGYFDRKPSLETVKEKVRGALRIYGFEPGAAGDPQIKELRNEDWLAKWKESWTPTETDKFVITPPWTEIADTQKLLIKIEPGMAFGTGTHETTLLCLRAIEEYYFPEMSFLDVGTGTGVLAIAASKFRVQSSKFKVKESHPTQNFEPQTLNPIAACDVDPEAIKIARENARLNRVNKIDFYVGSISEKTQAFDFVCANLTVDVIVSLLPLLIEKTRKVLVLSGILVEQERQIIAQLDKYGFTTATVERSGEWISVRLNTGQN